MNDQDRKRAFSDWYTNVILGSDIEAVSHEAFCAGWEAAAPLTAAAISDVREALDDTKTAVLALAAVPAERRTDMQVAELMEAADRLAGCVHALLGFPRDRP